MQEAGLHTTDYYLEVGEWYWKHCVFGHTLYYAVPGHKTLDETIKTWLIKKVIIKKKKFGAILCWSKIDTYRVAM